MYSAQSQSHMDLDGRSKTHTNPSRDFLDLELSEFNIQLWIFNGCIFELSEVDLGREMGVL